MANLLLSALMFVLLPAIFCTANGAKIRFSPRERYMIQKNNLFTSQNLTNRIIGGRSITNINFHVGAYIEDSVGNEWGCPGVAIHRRWVISAAHCYMGDDDFGPPRPVVVPEKVRIFTPAKTRRDYLEPSAAVIYKVDALYFPINWDDYESLDHDLIVIRLSRKIPKEVFQKVKLPRKRKHQAKADETLYVVQFAHNPDGVEDKLGDKLQIAPMIHKTVEQLEPTVYTEPDEFDIAAVSTGWPNEATTGTCGGDSGSGIFRRLSNGRYMLMGITSSGDDCEEPDAMHYFASTYAHPEIRSLIKKNDETKWRKVSS